MREDAAVAVAAVEEVAELEDAGDDDEAGVRSREELAHAPKGDGEGGGDGGVRPLGFRLDGGRGEGGTGRLDDHGQLVGNVWE